MIIVHTCNSSYNHPRLLSTQNDYGQL